VIVDYGPRWRRAKGLPPRERSHRSSKLLAIAGPTLLLTSMQAFYCGADDAVLTTNYWVIPKAAPDVDLVVLRINKNRAIAAPLDRGASSYRRELRIVEMKDGLAARLETFRSGLKPGTPFEYGPPRSESLGAVSCHANSDSEGMSGSGLVTTHHGSTPLAVQSTPP
jgi:hypothetical protein